MLCAGRIVSTTPIMLKRSATSRLPPSWPLTSLATAALLFLGTTGGLLLLLQRSLPEASSFSSLAAVSLRVPNLDHVCRAQPWLRPGFTILTQVQHLVRNCSTARLLVMGEPMDPATSLAASLQLGPTAAPTDMFPTEGFSSIVTTISASLRLAVEYERTLVLNAAGWAYGGDEECSASLPPMVSPWECIFLPLSRCTVEDATVAETEDAAAEARREIPPAVDSVAVRRRRYARKNDLRARVDDTGKRWLARFSVSVPAPLAALQASDADWTAVSRAYLHAQLTSSTHAALATYQIPTLSAPASPAELSIGMHVRTGDRGGGGRDLSTTWSTYASLAMRIAVASGARVLVIATDDDDAEWIAAAAAALPVPPPSFSVYLVPRRVARFDAWQPMAEQLGRRPHLRANATLDVIAAVEALGRCTFLIGRGDSTLMRLAASLSRARGCAGGGSQVPATWSVGGFMSAPGPIELEESSAWGNEMGNT